MPDADVTVSRVGFAAADGTPLGGDLHVPSRPRAAAIVCHPHPSYGGDRNNPVVVELATVLAGHGVAALRFDFRRQFDGGRGERVDAAAALDVVAESFGNVPLFATGYSFGAMIASSLDDARIVAQALVAPPFTNGAPLPVVPTLLVVPAHDQFAPPSVVEPVLAAWRAADADVDVELTVVASADHFLAGRVSWTAGHAARWLADRLSAPNT